MITKIRQPGVVQVHEALGAPFVYQHGPERQADSSPKTNKASGDDELPEIKQDVQGLDDIIVQLLKIHDPHEKQRREERQSEEQMSYIEPEEQGGPRESLIWRGAAPQELQVDQASLQNAKSWTATSDSDAGPEPDLWAQVNST
jgi:hypothetical protein